MLAQHLGASLAADTAATGVNYDWMQEFGDQATGHRRHVQADDHRLRRGARQPQRLPRQHRRGRSSSSAPRRSYILLWIFLAGGIIDRYARDRATAAHGFFSASGVFFFRFLRLAVVQWIVYAIAVRSLCTLAVRHGLSAPHARDDRRSGPRSSSALALYLVFGVLRRRVQRVFDYAKVRAVVEDRRSMLGA